MNIKSSLQYIPLAIMTLAIGYSIYTILTTNILLAGKHYWGIFFVLASIVAIVLNRKTGKVVTLITLLAGALNLIAFTPVITAYTFGFSVNNNGLDLKVQPFSLWVLLLFIVINIKAAGRVLRWFFTN
ncbi:hypothetical protein F3J22_22300 [Chitinophaga sp. Cy-1792]|nr:hypothetical protein [Chitinophaga sp. Cy-1792]